MFVKENPDRKKKALMQRGMLHNKILIGVNMFLQKSNKFCVSILRKRKQAIF